MDERLSIQVQKVKHFDYAMSVGVTRVGRKVLTARSRVVFLLRTVCRQLSRERQHEELEVPRAAVLSVPKGKFLSETGSQTSISPSRIMLQKVMTPFRV